MHVVFIVNTHKNMLKNLFHVIIIQITLGIKNIFHQVNIQFHNISIVEIYLLL